MNQFLSGAMAMGYMLAGLFFLRFFRETRDRLFAMFAASFAILGINRIAIAAANPADEASPILFYLIRLLAFLLILAAIIDKNRSRLSERDHPQGGPLGARRRVSAAAAVTARRAARHHWRRAVPSSVPAAAAPPHR